MFHVIVELQGFYQYLARYELSLFRLSRFSFVGQFVGEIMPRQIGILKAIDIPRIKEAGLHSDGGGLNLRVTAKGGKFWVYRFMLNKKAREMGLGALHSLTLADARKKATECRKLVADGIDPIKARDDINTKSRLEAARVQTFKQCAEAYIEVHKTGWNSSKHIQQWENTLTDYVYPIFGDFPIQDVDVVLVMKVFEQKSKAFAKGETLWVARSETASRLRGRIEKIMDWATVREYRQGENPARWRGHLESLLPHRTKGKEVVHHPALPYVQMGDFMAVLKEQEGTSALALAFTILTAARTSETLRATWDEIDLQNKVWTVPGVRMKGGREHRVPLTEPALRILKKLKDESNESKWIFIGENRSKHLSNMAMLMLLKRMKRQDITVHGFRSSFRDWAAEQTSYPREVAEACLAHISGDKVEQAYLRGDFFGKRCKLMAAWAQYCSTPSIKNKTGNTVVNIATRKR